MPETEQPEVLLDLALDAIRAGGQFEAKLDEIDAPVYLTDAEGRVTFWNRACVDFAGREPQLGEDRWCVTWKLYTTDGQPLAHEDCPLAVAIREKRPVREEIAIAMRPDGSRKAFRPYPTPLFDDSGELTGAINMLIDISDLQVQSLSEQSERCRRLSRATHDREAAEVLSRMAADYDQRAAILKPQG